MSVKLMAQVFQTRFDWGKDAPVEPTIKFVMLALADHASDTGEAVYPSVAHLCDKTGLARRSVLNVIKAARARGVLVAIGKRRQVIEYKLSLDQCTTCTSAPDAPVPVHQVHRTSAPRAHVTIIEPSTESPIVPAAPTPEPKPARQPQSNPQSEMIGALMKVTGSTSGGRLARPAADLIRAGKTAADVLAAYSPGGWWYANDWRGKKGQAPTVQQVIDTAGLTAPAAERVPDNMLNRQPVRNKHNADPNEVTPDMTPDEVRVVLRRMNPMMYAQ